MRTLSTVDDVIDLFGGPAKTARWACTSTNAVCWWRHRRIPPAIHLRLLIEARRRDVRIGRDVFDLDEDEWKQLYKMLDGENLAG